MLVLVWAARRTSGSGRSSSSRRGGAGGSRVGRALTGRRETTWWGA